jgi:RHS repeat-associated protein
LKFPLYQKVNQLSRQPTCKACAISFENDARNSFFELKRSLYFVLLLTVLTASAHVPRASMELTPGAHQLTAQARHPSGQFTTNKIHWVTNSVARHTATDSFDRSGNLTNRIWRNANGTTNRIQNLTWDARGRLVKVTERDPGTNGLNWSATYDAFNRRLVTTSVLVTNGITLSNQPTVISVTYDPEVEFLELGVTVNGRTTWKLQGPDLNGIYGGLNGLGGFDAIIPGPELFCPTLSDARGNVLAVYDQTHGTLTWNQARPTGYGAVPAYRPPPLGHGADLVQASAWRGRWMDVIGSFQIGLRPYLPESGSWGSPDPMGHDGSENLLTFANSDPINFFDSDGRVGAGTYQNMGWSPAFLDRMYELTQQGVFNDDWIDNLNPQARAYLSNRGVANTSSRGFLENAFVGATQGDFATEDTGWGGIVGQTGSGFIPVYGQIGDVRDTAAAFNNLGDGGWREGGNWAGAAAAVVAWVPGLDWVKGARKVAGRLDDVPTGTITPPHGGGGGPPPGGGGAPPSGGDVIPPPRAGPLPPGEQPYQLTLFPDQPYNRTAHYGRTPTTAQQASVPPGMEFDHNPPLVQHYYEGAGNGSLPGFNLTQTERVQYGASLGSGGAATPGAQRAQGGTAAQYSREQKRQWGF